MEKDRTSEHMKIYTTYFANIRHLPPDVIPISVSLYPPKGYTGLSYPPLFPTPEILKLAKSGNLPPEKYIPLYKHQVLDHLNFQKTIQELQTLSNNKDIALICYEKYPDFCHRHVISHWMNIKGMTVQEYIPPAHTSENEPHLF